MQPVEQHPHGVFDVSFEASGWEACGWVPAHFPLTIVVVDGEREICRGTAGELLLDRRDTTLKDAWRFRFPVPGAGVDRYEAYALETGITIPRLRNSDD